MEKPRVGIDKSCSVVVLVDAIEDETEAELE